MKGRPDRAHPFIRSCVADIEMDSGVTEDQIFSDARPRGIVLARHQLILYVYARTGECEIETSRITGFDRSTIRNARRRSEKRAQEQRKVRRCYGVAPDGDRCVDLEPWSARFFQHAV